MAGGSKKKEMGNKNHWVYRAIESITWRWKMLLGLAWITPNLGFTEKKKSLQLFNSWGVNQLINKKDQSLGATSFPTSLLLYYRLMKFCLQLANGHHSKLLMQSNNLDIWHTTKLWHKPLASENGRFSVNERLHTWNLFADSHKHCSYLMASNETCGLVLRKLSVV